MITTSTVNEVLSIIGSVKDIAENEEETTEHHAPFQNKIEESGKKRLYRDIDHRVIGGVCSGLANYFGIDRVLVRLIFCGALFLVPLFSKLIFFGWGFSLFPRLSGLTLIAYITLWIVMPAARTMQEKMVMRNEPIISSSGHNRNDRDTHDLHRHDFGSVLGRFVGGFFRVIGWLVVGVMAFIALILIFAIPIGLVTGNAVAGNWGYINLAEILQTYTYIPAWLVGMLAMFIICIPLIFAIYGICKLLFRFKSKIRVGLILFLIWLVSLLSLAGIITYIASQDKNFPESIFYDSTTAYTYAEEHTLEPFSKLSLQGNFDVKMIKADTNYIRIESNKPFTKLANINTVGEWLRIDLNDLSKKKWHKKSRLKLTIYTKNLEKLDISGGVNFVCIDTLRPTVFDAELSGAGKINLLLDVPKAKFDLAGAAKVELRGQADYAEFDISGAGKVDAFDFAVNNMEVDISGTGKMNIHVKHYLKADASGVADIQYKGNPTVNMEKSGVVKIKKVD